MSLSASWSSLLNSTDESVLNPVNIKIQKEAQDTIDDLLMVFLSKHSISKRDISSVLLTINEDEDFNFSCLWQNISVSLGEMMEDPILFKQFFLNGEIQKSIKVPMAPIIKADLDSTKKIQLSDEKQLIISLLEYFVLHDLSIIKKIEVISTNKGTKTIVDFLGFNFSPIESLYLSFHKNLEKIVATILDIWEILKIDNVPISRNEVTPFWIEDLLKSFLSIIHDNHEVLWFLLQDKELSTSLSNTIALARSFWFLSQDNKNTQDNIVEAIIILMALLDEWSEKFNALSDNSYSYQKNALIGLPYVENINRKTLAIYHKSDFKASIKEVVGINKRKKITWLSLFLREWILLSEWDIPFQNLYNHLISLNDTDLNAILESLITIPREDILKIGDDEIIEFCNNLNNPGVLEVSTSESVISSVQSILEVEEIDMDSVKSDIIEMMNYFEEDSNEHNQLLKLLTMRDSCKLKNDFEELSKQRNFYRSLQARKQQQQEEEYILGRWKDILFRRVPYDEISKVYIWDEWKEAIDIFCMILWKISPDYYDDWIDKYLLSSLWNGVPFTLAWMTRVYEIVSFFAEHDIQVFRNIDKLTINSYNANNWILDEILEVFKGYETDSSNKRPMKQFIMRALKHGELRWLNENGSKISQISSIEEFMKKYPSKQY